jgi:hypothetical protein
MLAQLASMPRSTEIMSCVRIYGSCEFVGRGRRGHYDRRSGGREMDVSPGPTSVRFPILCIQLKDSLTTLRSFAADYDSSKAIGVPVSNVMDFARSKLVCGSFTGNNMTSEAILACLSVRFALDFDLSAARARSQLRG